MDFSTSMAVKLELVFYAFGPLVNRPNHSNDGKVDGNNCVSGTAPKKKNKNELYFGTMGLFVNAVFEFSV